tara:strand:- start:260 stop:622 length:363 start_codon:yes stop_codon:yes gene_type:complete
MILTAQVDRHKHISRWIKIWNGGLGLTDKEQVFLGELLYRTMDLADKGIEEPYLGQLVFNTKTLKEIKEKLSLSKQGLNNYKIQLMAKGVLTKDDDYYHIKPQLIPQKSITFKFIYDGAG